MSQSSLYERLGGEAGIEFLVVHFYGRVLQDPALARFFMNMDTKQLIKKQVAFMTLAFGGPNTSSGTDLRTAHRGPVSHGMTDEHFDAVVRHLRDTLVEQGLSSADIEESIAVVETTRKDVLCR